MLSLHSEAPVKRSAVAVAALLFAACAPAPETAEQATARMQAEADSARPIIEAAAVAAARYINGNHADSLANQFAENGVMMPPGAPAAVGREAIRAALAAQPMPPGATVTFTVVEVVANGPIAVERGTSSFTIPAQGRTPAVTIPGKYLTHWHRVNGTWQQAAVIWSDDVPPMPGN